MPPQPFDAWSAVAREYHRYIAPGFRPVARGLCALAPVHRGDVVLDIACGPGTAAFAAREAGAARVTGIDRADGMVRLARDLARGQPMTFAQGDAVALPLMSGRFDVVLSSFGVIFAPDPERAVQEMARVLAPGGRLAISAWPRAGAVGEYYDVIDRHLVPEVGHDPHAWAISERARTWLGPAFEGVAIQPIEVPFEAPSPEAAWEILRGSTGRVSRAYGDLSATARSAMDREVIAFFDRLRRTDGTVYWPRQALLISGVASRGRAR